MFYYLCRVENMLYEFYCEIYPRRVWIAVGRGLFADRLDGVEEMAEDVDAQVDCVRDASRGLGGYLIRFESIQAMTFNTITHESVHVAMEICRYCNIAMDFDNQEPLAYLAGWVAGCCSEVLASVTKKP